jgi:DNA-nicking Smr family endonuclease
MARADSPPPRSDPAPEDDAAVFRAEMGDVRPLAASDKVALRPEPKAPLPLQHQRDELHALAESFNAQPTIDDEQGDASTFLRPGLSRQVLRRLRGGHWVAQDELDLHGYTAAEAKPRLADFLSQALRGGARCVRVIHGKGLRSAAEREPVLRNKVRLWLSQREDVLAYCEARPADGGSGALMLLLRAPRAKGSAQADNEE